MSNKLVYDPLRRKEVALTPEEEVRQWFISVLHEELKVPMTMMMSEVSMKTGQVTGILRRTVKKEYRADILVYDRNLDPMLVVECKRPDIELTRDVLEQALRYCGILKVRYMVITNGKKSYFASSKDGRLVFLDKVPVYEEMIKDE